MKAKPPGNPKGWTPPKKFELRKEDKYHAVRFSGKKDEEGNEIPYEGHVLSREKARKIVEQVGTSPLKLDIGCGPNRRPGFIGVDIAESTGADIVMNMETQNLPFEDNSVDEIVCSHFLEHVHNLIPIMNECHRVLKPRGVMVIYVPIYPSIQAFQDPTHVRFFTQMTLSYFDEKNPYWTEVGKHYGIKPFSQIVQSVQKGWELVASLKK
jgi:SAM-dependent methyltransferase